MSDISDGSLTFDPKWAKNLKYHDPIKLSELEGDEPKARKLINLPWQKNYVYGRQDPKNPFSHHGSQDHFYRLSPFYLIIWKYLSRHATLYT